MSSCLLRLALLWKWPNEDSNFLSVDINLSDALNFTIEKEGLRMPFITVDGLGGVSHLILLSNVRPKFSNHSVMLKNEPRLIKQFLKD